MPKLIPLFDGGPYKRGEDNGRERVLLTAQEAEQIFYDPDINYETDNSVATELPMSKYASLLANLEVGDQLLVGLVPDAMVLRGLWMMSYDAVPGFKAKYDLVSVADVAAAVEAGDDPTAVAAYGAGSIAYNFEDGLGEASKDAAQLAELYGNDTSDHRNNAALRFATVAPSLLVLGAPLYMRLTITAVGELYGSEGACCSSCGDGVLPTMQIGITGDVLCAKKQRTRVYCNCNENLCSTC